MARSGAVPIAAANWRRGGSGAKATKGPSAPGRVGCPGFLLTKTGVRKVGGRVWGKVSSVKIEMDTDQDR